MGIVFLIGGGLMSMFFFFFLHMGGGLMCMFNNKEFSISKQATIRDT